MAGKRSWWRRRCGCPPDIAVLQVAVGGCKCAGVEKGGGAMDGECARACQRERLQLLLMLLIHLEKIAV